MNRLARFISLVGLICLLSVSKGFASGTNPDPTDAVQLYQSAVEAMHQGLWMEALSSFETLCEHPEAEASLKESAWFHRIRLILETQPEQVDPLAMEYGEAFPHGAMARQLYETVGHYYWDSNRPEKARGYFTMAKQSRVDQAQLARVLYWEAETALEAGDLDRSLASFLELTQRTPEQPQAPEAYYSAGRLYLENQAYDKSAETFEQLREAHPFHPMTRRIGTALGESYYQERQFEQAAQAFLDALPYVEGEAEHKAVYLAAESYKALQRYDEAVRYYLQAINLTKGTPEERMSHYGLGWVYHYQGIYHWAARSFGEASGGEDELAQKALYYTAVNHKLANRLDLSIERFVEFQERFQEGVFVEEATYEYAVVLFERGRYGEAIDLLRQLAQDIDALKRPGDVLTLLGEVYFANGEYTRALQAFELAETHQAVAAAAKIQARFQKAWVLYINQAYAQAQPIFEGVFQEGQRVRGVSEEDQATVARLASESLFWSADAQFQLRQYGEAAASFESFVTRYPGHEFLGAARYAWAWAHFMNGEYEAVIEPMEAFLSNYDPPPIALYPFDTDARLRLGDAYFATGAYDQAIETYQRAFGAEPGGDYAMFQVANSYYRAGLEMEAIEEFRKLLRIYPFTRVREQAQYNIGYLFLTLGNTSQAVEEFERLIDQSPGISWAARAQFAIGDAYYNAGEYESAVEAYQVILEAYPRSSYIIDAIDGIQYATLFLGEESDAEELLETFLESHPSTTTADRLRFRQAESLVQSGDYQAAIREFEQYIRVTNREASLPAAYAGIGDAKRQLGDRDGAKEAYGTLVNQFPGSEQRLFGLTTLGQMALEEGDLRGAIDWFKKLQDGDDRFRVEALLGLAEAYRRLGSEAEQAQSLELYSVLLAEQPSSLQARTGLARLYMDQGKLVEAREVLAPARSVGVREQVAEANYLHARSYQLEGDVTRARNEYEQVTVLYEAFEEWASRSMFRLGELQILDGNVGEARVWLDRLMQTYPNTQAARDAQTLLNAAQ